MIMYNDIYNAFLAALRHFADNEGYGGQSILAANANISNGYLSQILKRPDLKKAGLKTQKSLAKACGYEIEDFILFGQNLLANQQEINSKQNISISEIINTAKNIDCSSGPDQITREHMELVKKFKFKEIAKSINEDLLRIEDQEILKEVEVIIKTISLGVGYEFKIVGKNTASSQQSRSEGKLKKGTGS